MALYQVFYYIPYTSLKAIKSIADLSHVIHLLTRVKACEARIKSIVNSVEVHNRWGRKRWFAEHSLSEFGNSYSKQEEAWLSERLGRAKAQLKSSESRPIPRAIERSIWEFQAKLDDPSITSSSKIWIACNVTRVLIEKRDWNKLCSPNGKLSRFMTWAEAPCGDTFHQIVEGSRPPNHEVFNAWESAAYKVLETFHCYLDDLSSWATNDTSDEYLTKNEKIRLTQRPQLTEVE